MATPVEVVVHVYDLSQGMAAALSQSLIGKQIDGVWHTGVVVFGREYFFGGGIRAGIPGLTSFGRPTKKLSGFTTEVTRDIFEDFLREIQRRYTVQTYNLLSHNCNNFSDELLQFLTGSELPSSITNLPSEVMDSPLGAMIAPLLSSFEAALNRPGDTSFG